MQTSEFLGTVKRELSAEEPGELTSMDQRSVHFLPTIRKWTQPKGSSGAVAAESRQLDGDKRA